MTKGPLHRIGDAGRNEAVTLVVVDSTHTEVLADPRTAERLVEILSQDYPALTPVAFLSRGANPP